MTVVSTISIKLDAQTAALRKGFQDTAQATRRLGDRMSKGFGASFIKFNAVVMAARNALGLLQGAFSSVFDTISKFAELQDFADRIGVSSERLNELRMVTEQWGGSASAMNTSLQRLIRRLADAAEKGGPLADKLSSIGMNVQNMARMRPDEQFLAMSEAIGRLGSAGEQASLAMAAMDMEGVSMLETLRQGPDAIKEQMNAMGEMYGVTEQQMKQSQVAQALIEELKLAWDKLKDSVLMSLVPALIKLVEWLTKLIDLLERGYELYRKGVGRLFGVEFEEPPKKMFDTVDDLMAKATAATAGGMEKVADTAVKKTKELRMEMAKIPGVAAVTSTSAAGFSAVQEARRRAQEQAAWEREMRELTVRSVALLGTISENLLLVPVTI